MFWLSFDIIMDNAAMNICVHNHCFLSISKTLSIQNMYNYIWEPTKKWWFVRIIFLGNGGQSQSEYYLIIDLIWNLGEKSSGHWLLVLVVLQLIMPSAIWKDIYKSSNIS